MKSKKVLAIGPKRYRVEKNVSFYFKTITILFKESSTIEINTRTKQGGEKC